MSLLKRLDIIKENIGLIIISCIIITPIENLYELTSDKAEELKDKLKQVHRT